MAGCLASLADTSIEDAQKKFSWCRTSQDVVSSQYFNGVATIEVKTKAALKENLGGVMIWEAGQDCRRVAVTHGGKTHEVTCPDGEKSSLLAAVNRALQNASKTLQRPFVPAAAPSGSAGGEL